MGGGAHVVGRLARLALELARLLGHLSAGVGDEARKQADAAVEHRAELWAREEQQADVLEG